MAKTRSSPEIDWICSSTLIAPKTVLTAAHCLYGPNGRRIGTSRLRFSVEGETYRAKSAHVASTYYPLVQVGQDDLARIELTREPEVEPIPVADFEPLEDEPATVIGFGATRASSSRETSGGGRRRIAEIWIGDLRERELIYDAEERGACYGDSGGPVLQDLGSGEVVVGVTSRGTNAACDGLNVATRADVFAEWLRD